METHSLEALRLTRVCEKSGLSGATVWNLVKAGKFPAPFKLTGRRAVAWSSEEVDRWLRDRIAERDAESRAQDA